MIFEAFAIFLSSIAGYSDTGAVVTANEINTSEVTNEVVTQTTNLDKLIDIQVSTAAAKRIVLVCN